MTEKAVILLSGGLDSSTVLGYAIKRGLKCSCLSIHYGQRHDREVQSAKAVARHFGSEFHEVSLNLGNLLVSSLTGHGEVEKRRISEISEYIPNTYVPGRNIIMIAIASGYCQSIGGSEVYIGANALDYSGYPDCRPEFFNAMEKAVNIGTGLENTGGIRIVAPLQYLKKSEIIRMGIDLGVPYSLTWSCYEGGEKPCGKCDSCLLRIRGFEEAGFKDPLEYG